MSTAVVRRTRASLAIGATVLVTLSVLPSIVGAAFPGSNGRIAFAGRSGSTSPYYHIFTVLPNGAGTQQLTDPPTNELEPSWSANGSGLAYIRGTPGASGYQVFRMTADGGEKRVTHDNGIDGSPGFSPNGRRIVYSKDNLPTAGANNPRRVSIFKTRTDGTDKRLLVRGGFVNSPAYFPDGKRIAFSGTPAGRHRQGIWTIRSDGSHLRRLTNPGMTGSYDQYPDWSPDGTHIVFLRCGTDSTPGCDGNAYLMRADGSYQHAVKRISGEVPPVFSPGGGRIALSTAGEDCDDIYTISLTGSNPHAVTHNCEDFNNGGPGGFAAQPSWQPLPGG
jgi:TolB protein